MKLAVARALRLSVATLVSMLLACEASGQVRTGTKSAPTQATRQVEGNPASAKLAAVQEFLGQLVGKYRYEGRAKIFYSTTERSQCEAGVCYAYSEITGEGRCDQWDAGAGLRCDVALRWPEFVAPANQTSRPNGGERWLGPQLDQARILYGIDPHTGAIHMLIVDGRSIAIRAVGTLKDSLATFETDCGLPPERAQAMPRCKRVFWLRSRLNGRNLEMRFEYRGDGHKVGAGYDLSLRRVEAGGSP